MGECHPLAMTACSRKAKVARCARVVGGRDGKTSTWQLQYVLRDNQYDSETESVESDN